MAVEQLKVKIIIFNWLRRKNFKISTKVFKIEPSKRVLRNFVYLITGNAKEEHHIRSLDKLHFLQFGAPKKVHVCLQNQIIDRYT